MKKFLVLFAITSIFVFSCKKEEVEEKTIEQKTIDKTEPSCLIEKIKVFEGSACENSLKVKKYQFGNDNVYLFDISSCLADAQLQVINYNCDSIGKVGGYPVNNKINGIDFYKNATFIKLVYEK